MHPKDTMTTDTFFNGKIKVCQTRDGYRFSIDAILLAAVVQPKPGEVVLDMGTGCGVVPIVLAHRFPQAQYIGVELQETLAGLATQNIAANDLKNLITILHLDLRSLKNENLDGPVDWIVSNPPYRPADSGRINPNAERAVARHEIHLRLSELMQACRRFLRTGGRFAVIYPVERLVDLLGEMRSAGIEPKWMRIVHSYQFERAKLVLVVGVMRGKPGLKVAPPLVVYDPDGNYSQEVEAMMKP